jgi:hypothetical protein
MLTAVWITIISFAVVVVLSFFAEVIIEPALEDVAKQREAERIERAREQMPSAGGLMPTRIALTSGPADSHPNVAHARPTGSSGMVGSSGIVGGGAAAAKGRRLDVTLPEEHTAPPPRAASGAVGAPAAAASQGGEGFQDLASLLKEAAQPSPVPVRQR